MAATYAIRTKWGTNPVQAAEDLKEFVSHFAVWGVALVSINSVIDGFEVVTSKDIPLGQDAHLGAVKVL